MHVIKHTANFQVCSFIGSSEYHLYDLSPYELTILFIIARYLDMPAGKCFGKQKTLAMDCKMSVRQFRRASEILIKNNLIIRTIRGKLYHYYLGEGITVF